MCSCVLRHTLYNISPVFISVHCFFTVMHYQLCYRYCTSTRLLIVFGGFYDTLREVRYHNDLYVFDLDQFKWQEITLRPGAMRPSARSGFQFLFTKMRSFCMVAIPKKFHLIKLALRKELFIQIYGPLILDMGMEQGKKKWDASWTSYWVFYICVFIRSELCYLGV
ncbi:putative kelch-type beta propeller [Rosa chinensis]|uniref:Putative kelch-type beta propeller n=1 Tax=Rosa chinensis TaxID=74649 RepID=A0A2P6PPK6_ROSCH|nr:putative kelch-type beta propeller [Rosa chinensis]